MKRFITLILLLTILVTIGTGCAAAGPVMAPSAPTMDSAPASSPPAPRASAPTPDQSASAPSADFAEATEHTTSYTYATSILEVDESAVALPMLTPSDSRGKRLVYNVDMQLQTTEFMPSIRTLFTTLASMGGYVETEMLQGRDMRFPGTERHVIYTVRIHSDRLSEFLVVIEDNFNLVFRNRVGTNVTVDFEHTEATLDDLREREVRIRNILEDGSLNNTERRNYNRQLEEVQSNIRNRERQRNVFDDSIHYSTLTIQILEVILPEDAPDPEPDLTFGERFGEAARNMGNGLLRGLQTLAIGIVLILPALIILVVIAVVVIIVYRRTKKANKNHKNPPNDHDTHND